MPKELTVAKSNKEPQIANYDAFSRISYTYKLAKKF
jgi:hypothetical protein